MNNQFLQHLKSITPQGKAEEKKIFISAERLKELEAEAEGMEELDEATRSKYIKAYGRHKVGTDTTKLDIEDAKRNAAVLRRGGADDETIRQGSFTGKIPMSQYNKVNMAKYRFGSKAARSMEDGKKSPRNVKEEMELDEGLLHKKRLLRARLSGKTQRLFPMTEGVQRMRRLRTARFGKQGVKKELDAAYDKELSKVSASRLRRGGAPKQTVRGFFTDKPTTKAADKAYSKFSKDAMNKASAKGKKIFEAKAPANPVSKLKKVKRKMIKTKNRVRALGSSLLNILGTPQDNTDYMITGRKF